VGCSGVDRSTEFEFIRQLADRRPNECRGPLIGHIFSGYTVAGLEESFQSESAHDLLWDGFLPDCDTGLAFELCAAHWMDLACLTTARSRQHARRDWHALATFVLRETTTAAGWDLKEISNLLVWRRVPLT
jgi:hypothetical protein